MKRKTYILLLIALMIGGRGMAEDNVLTENFQSYTPKTDYQNHTAYEYVGTWTTWSVTNGCVTTTGMDKAFGVSYPAQQGVALQYNGNTAYLRGTMTSGYIKGTLKEMSCKLACTHSSVRGTWYYSDDNERWNVLKGFPYGFDQSNVGILEIPIPTEVKALKGIYLKLEITSGDNGKRVLVDDIRIVTEVEDECGNCFPITL